MEPDSYKPVTASGMSGSGTARADAASEVPGTGGSDGSTGRDGVRASASNGAARGVRARYEGFVRRKRLVLAAAALLAALLALASLSFGSSALSACQVLGGLFRTGDAYAQAVVWNLRMPRVLAAIIGGAALALAGCVFQGVLRNPLASASTLGIAQGAAFGAAFAIVVLGALGTAGAGGADASAAATAASSATASSTVAWEGTASQNPYLTAMCAFAGAMLSALVILGLARLRDMTPESIVLAGVALSALFTGATALIEYFAEDAQVAAVVFWTFGDLGRAGWEELAVMAVVTAAAAVFFWVNRWNYNALESGEGSAHGLGVNVSRARTAGVLVAAAAASTTIAFCGTIGFVGLVAPHIMRRLVGSDLRFLLPASAVAGTAVLLASDLLARAVLAPVILPVGAITSFVGAPVFLYLLMRGGRR